MSQVIIDAGPLVAWYCSRDANHPWAAEAFRQLPAGCILCEAVLTEVCHLVAKEGVERARVLADVEQGRFQIFPLAGEITALRHLLDQYLDIDMDFADACVVRLSELHQRATVCTTDTDLKVYRRHGRQVIPLLAPWV